MKTEIIKRDLLNQLNNKKYLQEQELVRLAGLGVLMSHPEKIDRIEEVFEQISLINTKIQLAESYFVEEKTKEEQSQKPIDPGQAQNPYQSQPGQPQKNQPHPGQSHGE